MVKFLLLLSHGQAIVERGFSINRQMSVDHMKEVSHVSQSLSFDNCLCCYKKGGRRPESCNHKGAVIHTSFSRMELVASVLGGTEGAGSSTVNSFEEKPY